MGRVRAAGRCTRSRVLHEATWNPKQMVGMALNTAIQVEGLGRETATGQSGGTSKLCGPLLICPQLSHQFLPPGTELLHG